MGALIAWKKRNRRKPLILEGARQVGKTWLLQEFGRNEFEQTAYINCDANSVLAAELEQGYDLDRLLRVIQIQSGTQVLPEKTLLILDEIQEIPQALTALKYFREQKPELAIVAAGSLLGLAMHSGTGFPVGNVDLLKLYPLTFTEYLEACGQELLAQTILGDDPQMMDRFAEDCISHLRDYFFVGGMPEAVLTFAETDSYAEVRRVQDTILRTYELDISKHLGRGTEAALAAWRSIPAHLSEENKRFVFGRVRAGARAKAFEGGLTWLAQAGLITLVRKVRKCAVPLSGYVDSHIFKVFLLDIGLLGAMAELSSDTLIRGQGIFEEFRGAYTEQYVCQQLRDGCSLTPYYWKRENASNELDFLVQKEARITAIEVKASENLRSKSLRAFHDAHPETQAVRFSLSPYRREDWMTNVPLYAVQNEALWNGATTS